MTAMPPELALLQFETVRIRDARKIRSLLLTVMLAVLACCALGAGLVVEKVVHAAELAEVESQRDQSRVELKATSERLEEVLRVLNAVRSP